MTNETQKNENKPEEQTSTPAMPEELTDEQLEQVVGGYKNAPNPIYLNPDPTMVE